MLRYSRSSVVGVVLGVVAVVGVVFAADIAPTTGEDPVASDVIPPRVLVETQKAPEYPPAARAARFTGKVVVKTQILADGKVGDVEVVDCDSPNLGFEDATVAAVKQWEFKPALHAGRAVDFTGTFTLTFGNPHPGYGDKGVVIAGGYEARPSRAPVGSVGVK